MLGDRALVVDHDGQVEGPSDQLAGHHGVGPEGSPPVAGLGAEGSREGGVPTYVEASRLSKGHLQWWPRETGGLLQRLPAEQLLVLIYNGYPPSAALAEAWRRIS